MRHNEFPVALRKLPPPRPRPVPVVTKAPRCDGGGRHCPAPPSPPGVPCPACGSVKPAPGVSSVDPRRPAGCPHTWPQGAVLISESEVVAYRRRWDLPIDAVVVDFPLAGFRPYLGPQDPVVVGMRATLASGGELPPIIIDLGGGLLDGRHRITTALLLGRHTIRAYVPGVRVSNRGALERVVPITPHYALHYAGVRR